MSAARARAEERYRLLQQFKNVKIKPAQTQNKGGLGEFVFPDDPTNPSPGDFTITVGPQSKNLQGGISDTVIADMVHAASELNPQFKSLKKELVSNLSEAELSLARRRFEKDFKGKFSGTNFSSFENFLNSVWADGIVQDLLLPENSEIEEIMKANPGARQTLERIKRLFLEGK